MVVVVGRMVLAQSGWRRRRVRGGNIRMDGDVGTKTRPRSTERMTNGWTDGGKTTAVVAALTCHLSVREEGSEEERKGGVTL